MNPESQRDDIHSDVLSRLHILRDKVASQSLKASPVTTREELLSAIETYCDSFFTQPQGDQDVKSIPDRFSDADKIIETSEDYKSLDIMSQARVRIMAHRFIFGALHRARQKARRNSAA